MPPGFHQTSGRCHAAGSFPGKCRCCWWMLPKLWRIEYVHKKISILHTEILQWRTPSAQIAWIFFLWKGFKPKSINLSMLQVMRVYTWSITRNVYNTCILTDPKKYIPKLVTYLLQNLLQISIFCWCHPWLKSTPNLCTTCSTAVFLACLTNQLFLKPTRFLAVLTSNIPKPKSVFVCKYLVLSGSWDLKSHKNGGMTWGLKQ